MTLLEGSFRYKVLTVIIVAPIAIMNILQKLPRSSGKWMNSRHGNDKPYSGSSGLKSKDLCVEKIRREIYSSFL